MKNLTISICAILLFGCSKESLIGDMLPGKSEHKLSARAADGNKSLFFSNNYGKVVHDSSFNLKAFTLEAWIRRSGTGTLASSGSGGVSATPIISKGRADADAPAEANVNYFIGIDANNKLVADFEEGAGANHPVISNTAIKDTTWTHVAVSYEPVSAVWKVYINGVLDVTKDLGSDITPAYTSLQPFGIATTFINSGTAGGYFRGNIDEVRVWRTARADGDIFSNYKLEVSAGTGLVARYGMNENTGSLAANSVSSNTPATLSGSPQWQSGFDYDITSVTSPVTTPSKPAHIVFVWMENKGYSQIIGSSSAPYINSLKAKGTLFTDAHGTTHPSYPNYISFFSGSNQGVTTNNCINNTPFSSQTMYNSITNAGYSFKWYSEGLPKAGSGICESGYYKQKHNPTTIFSTVPATVNQPLTALNLTDTGQFKNWPNVVNITPNMINDMHDGSIQQGDTWLKTNFDKYVQWAMKNNSILVVYYDEDNQLEGNRIPVIMVGQYVKPNNLVSTTLNHYSFTKLSCSLFSASTSWASNVNNAVLPSGWKL